ncbi:MAG: DNA polymerase III subunit gamma/tau [Candidatus Omnitrophica bacterium]|nr:DNA polymerase III subunit gamma/tau [Candidatus Omnitrophota bacterium]
MSQLAYARKYRPKDFDEIIDQEHIATTLKNAIARDNIAHAYLFSGPRGIGKTSTARILAKALNCSNGPTQKPCNKCIACQEISAGKSLDVLEIDGASNRGIDEIRTLRENVKFAPSASKFKIYIIDEVHMLTTEAFNALLKTLEEPPAHVKFIFATTEPQKVLPTILSRCQRFDFRRITAEGIISKLKQLIKQESIECEEEALYAIAKSADGSLRDAEVILDQLNSFSQSKVTLSAVSSVLGLVSKKAVFDIVDKLQPEHIAQNLIMLNDLIREGKDPSQLISAFIEHFRDMMLIKCQSEKLVTLPKEDKENIIKQSSKFKLENILYCIAVLMQAQERMKRQGMGRLLLESAMLKLSKQQELLPVKLLLEKVQALEDKLKKLGPGSFETGGISKSSKQVDYQEPKPEKPINKAVSSLEIPQVKPVEESFAPRSIKAEREKPYEAPQSALITATEPAALTLDSVWRIWPSLINQVRRKKINVGMYLAEGKPLKVRKNVVEVGFLNECEFHRESLMETKNLEIIEQAASNILNVRVKFDLLDCKELPKDKEDEMPVEEESFSSGADDSQEGQDFNDFIQSAMDVFNGRIVSTNE